MIGVKDGCRSVASSGITTKVKDPLGNIQISGTSTNNSVTITWGKVTDAVKYQVSVNGGTFKDPSSGTTINDTTHTITGLNPDETITIVVKAYTSDPNGYGNSTSETWTQTTIVCNAITFKVSNDSTLCEGSAALLKLLKTNVLHYKLRWNYQLPTSQSTFSFVPTSTITVPVQLIDSLNPNCPYYRNIKLVVNERDALSLGASDTSYQICQGSFFNLTAQPDNLDNYTFKKGNVTLQNGANPKLQVTNYVNGDTITVMATAKSCAALNDAKYAKVVNPLPSSVIDANVTGNACQGQDILYSALPMKNASKYSFFEGGILVQASGTNSYSKTNVQPGVLNPVTLVVKDLKTGCSSLLSAPKTITVAPYTVVSASSNLTGNIVCSGSEIVFTILPNTLPKYKFFVNDTLKQDSIVNRYTRIDLKDGDKVSVVGVNASNCESPTIASMTVTVKPVVQPSIIADTISVCDGVLAKIKATIPTGNNPQISWNSGELNVDSISRLYSVDTKVKITATLNGCAASDSVIIDVDKAVPPVASIQQVDGVLKGGLAIVCRGETVKFTGSGSALGKYTWYDNAGAEISTTNQLEVSPENTSFYKLIASNKACKDTASLEVNIVSCGKTAQIFTPGSDGKNDVWVALDPSEYFKENTVTVFNRWGNEVFSATNYKNDWDGTNSNGEKLPEGTYYYVIKVQGAAESKVGYVMIKK